MILLILKITYIKIKIPGQNPLNTDFCLVITKMKFAIFFLLANLAKCFMFVYVLLVRYVLLEWNVKRVKCITFHLYFRMESVEQEMRLYKVIIILVQLMWSWSWHLSRSHKAVKWYSILSFILVGKQNIELRGIFRSFKYL